MAKPLTARRRRTFWVLAALLLAAGVELGARIIERVDNAAARRKNPFVEPINPVPAFEVVELGGVKMVRRTGFQPLMGTPAPFPLERPPGGLRVFVLGGSAAAGWPYHLGDTNLSALLRRKLQQLYPGRPVEVMNMAAGTYASHRVKLVLEEVVRFHPDAIFLYNGNNEFLENLVFRPRAPPSPWDRSAAARLSYRVLVALTTPLPRFDVKNYDLNAQVSNRLSFAFAQASRYREDPRQFELLLEHYRFNVEAMVATARAAGVPLFLVTCPVNLREWTPNVSRHRKDLAPAEKERFTALFREGVLALERGEPASAVAPLGGAIAIDDEYAEAHFRLGDALRRVGRREEAKQEFVRALQRDGFPFRELPEFQTVLARVAAERGARLVDIVAPLEAASLDGIPGYDVFNDYVHLTESAQEIAAHELLRGLGRAGLLPGVSPERMEQTRIALAPIFHPERDVYVADVTYTTAMLQHQHDRLDAFYERAIDVFTRAPREDPSLAAHCRARLQTYHVVHPIALAYRRLMRAEKLGLLHETFTPDQARRIYDEYTKTIRWWTASSLSDEEFQRRVPWARRPGGD